MRAWSTRTRPPRPLLSKSGGRQLALSAGPFIDPDPANRGMILLIRDLSREAEAERIKRDFVSMVGHELRTPLTTIRTSIDLMGEAEAGALSETQRHIVDILRTNSDRLLQLINDLLDMSALDSGRVEVQQATIDLSKLVREAVDSEQGAALEESIALRVEAPADGGVAVWADGARVRQVLVNLISNAVKYTPEGGHVTVRVVPMEPFARIDVQDDGIGIPRAEQERLFEKFSAPARGSDRAAAPGWGWRSRTPSWSCTAARSGARVMAGTAAPSRSPSPAARRRVAGPDAFPRRPHGRRGAGGG